jgi:hypothetical protein
MQRSPKCIYCELKLSAYSFQGGSRRTGRGESGVIAGQRNHHWVSGASTGSARARARRGRERTFGSRFKVLGASVHIVSYVICGMPVVPSAGEEILWVICAPHLTRISMSSRHNCTVSRACLTAGCAARMRL